MRHPLALTLAALAVLLAVAPVTAKAQEAPEGWTLSAFSQFVAAFQDDRSIPGFAERDAARALALERGEVDHEALKKMNETPAWLARAQKAQILGMKREAEAKKRAEKLKSSSGIAEPAKLSCDTCPPGAFRGPGE